MSAIFERGELTDRVAQRLSRCEVGDIVTWRELSALLGMDARPRGLGHCHVRRARLITCREANIVFLALPGEGLQRCNASQTIDRGGLRRRKARNQARYGLAELRTLDGQILSLPESEQRRLLGSRMLLSALYQEASGQSHLDRGIDAARPPRLDPSVFRGQ